LLSLTKTVRTTAFRKSYNTVMSNLINIHKPLDNKKDSQAIFMLLAWPCLLSYQLCKLLVL